jgi:hypothetical protein
MPRPFRLPSYPGRCRQRVALGHDEVPAPERQVDTARVCGMWLALNPDFPSICLGFHSTVRDAPKCFIQKVSAGIRYLFDECERCVVQRWSTAVIPLDLFSVRPLLPKPQYEPALSHKRRTFLRNGVGPAISRQPPLPANSSHQAKSKERSITLSKVLKRRKR